MTRIIPAMRAAILSIGDELALGQSLDTNSAYLADALALRSIIVDEHRTVVDDRAAIAAAIRELVRGRDLLITTGGLGPTADDVTRDALCDVVSPGRELVQDEQALRWLDHWFAGRGRPMPKSNLVQALRPATMRCIPNAHGTAPGLAGKVENCTIYALPGPPPEMIPMFRDHVIPELDSAAGITGVAPDSALVTGKVNLFGIGESLAAERIGDLMARDRTPLVGITVSGAIISVRVRATGSTDRTRESVAADLAEIEKRWQPYAFGRGDETLALALGKLLMENRRTLATAESCTGGWLGKAIVDVAGSSAYYLGGWVTYSNQMKTMCLGVDAELIEAHGAVSAEVARAMAEGARARADADHALAITGIAGAESSQSIPACASSLNERGSSESDGPPCKPVGLVYIALAQACRATSVVRRFEFTGDRAAIRERSTLAAMQMLRFALLSPQLNAEDVPLLWETRPEGAIGRI